MTAVRKKLVAILLCMVTLLAGIALLTSCGKNDKADDLKVTFMVEDDESSEWKQTAEYTAEKRRGGTSHGFQAVLHLCELV